MSQTLTPTDTENEQDQARGLYARTVEQALVYLTVCLKNAVLYGIAHPKAVESVRQAYRELMSAMDGSPLLSITRIDDQLLLEGFPLRDTSSALTSLAHTMQDRDIGQVIFEQNLALEDLERFIEILVSDADVLALHGGPEAAAQRRGLQHMTIERYRLGRAVATPEGATPRKSIEVYEDALAATRNAMAAVERGKGIDVAVVRAIVGEMLRSILEDHRSLISLAAIKSHDAYLYEHSVNVCVVSMFLGYTLGLTDAQISDLGVAALLHDVGKIFVPVEIARKPGPLTEEEWLTMQAHPLIGSRILARTRDLPELTSVVCFEHHIRYDRSGYPRITPRKPLNFYSLLVSTVDCYDSLTTIRPYRSQMQPKQAVGWMIYVGRQQFEPRILNRFAALLEVPPIGTIVKLNTGEWGAVVRGSERELGQPVVRVLVDAHSENVADKGLERDLAQRDPESRDYAIRIVDRLPADSQFAETIASALPSST